MAKAAQSHAARIRELEIEAALLDLRERELQVRQVELETERAEVEYAEFIGTAERTGVFTLFGDITEKSGKALVDKLHEWALRADDEAELLLVINSDGGEVAAGFAIYDTLRDIAKEHKVTTAVRGIACSMAAILVQAGDDRIMGAQSRLMFHQVSSMVAGTTKELREQAARLTALDAQIGRLIEDRTGMSMETYAARIDGTDWWLDAEQAKKAGFVDVIG